jgi:choline monooxygenase
MAITADQLQAKLAEGATLPAAWYVDPARYAGELNAIFEQTWQYVGPYDFVAEPGTFMTAMIGNKPVVITNSNGDLHAFLNVCRHRFCTVAKGRGARRSLQCPYHAWTYALDGRLLAAPRSNQEPGFDKEALSLLPARVERWGPMLFASVSADAPGLHESLGELPELYARAGLAMDDLRWRARREYRMGVNWKTAVENILECYHCPTVHPSYADVMDLQNYDLTMRDSYSIQSTKLNGEASKGDEQTYDTRGDVEDGIYAFVYPNFMANVNPGPGNFHTNFAQPVSPQEMVMINDFFFVPDVGEEDASRYVDFQHTVSLEDIEPVEAVQAGIASAALPHGRLLINTEALIQHFQRLVFTSLPD